MNTIREAFLRMQAGQIDADTFLAIVEQEMMKACEVTEGMVSDIKEIAEMFTTALQKRARGSNDELAKQSKRISKKHAM